MVLDNIAMTSCHPQAIPGHLRLGDGTVQISNQLSFGEAGGFSVLDHAPFAFERWGPGGSTKVSEQWGTDAVGDPLQLVALQTIYRETFGLPPVDSPNFIREAQKQLANSSDSRESSSASSSGSNEAQSDGSENGNSDGSQMKKRLKASEFEIPVGWFHLGERKDVPKHAHFVGRYEQR